MPSISKMSDAKWKDILDKSQEFWEKAGGKVNDPSPAIVDPGQKDEDEEVVESDY